MDTESPWASSPAEPPPVERRDPGLIPPPGPNAAQRALVTALGPLTVWGAGQVPLLPDVEYLTYTVGALGVTPILSAFVLVELAALIVPPWRSLRVSGRAGRARLGVAVAVLAILFTFGQSYIVARQLYDFANQTGVVLSLAGTTGFFAFIAVTIDRYGLGSGFANLIVSGFVIETFDILWTQFPYGPGEYLIHVLAPFVVAGVGLLFAAGRTGPAVRGTHEGARIPFIACGSDALGLFTWWTMVAYRFGDLGYTLPTLDVQGDAQLAVDAIIVLIGVVAATFGFSGPRRVTRMYAKCLGVDAEEADALARTAIGDALRLALLFGGAVLVVDYFGVPNIDDPPVLPRAITLFAIGMFARDLWREWRARSEHPDLVEIWPSHRPYAVVPVVYALRERGIDAFVFGVGYRTLGQVFAPYVPMSIVVPEEDGPRAQAIAAELLS